MYNAVATDYSNGTKGSYKQFLITLFSIQNVMFVTEIFCFIVTFLPYQKKISSSVVVFFVQRISNIIEKQPLSYNSTILLKTEKVHFLKIHIDHLNDIHRIGI